jgi:hypothetical protein
MKTLLAILATLFLLSCDGGACEEQNAGADECWPGPGKCWFSDHEHNNHGICCDDGCRCGASPGGGGGHMYVEYPLYDGCVPSADMPDYSCDFGCVCDLPAGGVVTDLPQ